MRGSRPPRRGLTVGVGRSRATLMRPPPQTQCTLNSSMNYSSPDLRAYHRLFGPSVKRMYLSGDAHRWKGTYQRALWNDGDLLFDVGGHLGNDLRYFLSHAPARASVHTYEPVHAFAKQLTGRLQRWHLPNRTTVHSFGLGATNRSTCMVNLVRQPNSPSSYERSGGAAFCPSPLSQIRDVVAVIASLAPRRITQLQLNCEGCEYEVLGRLLDHPAEVSRIDAFEVQFHLEFAGSTDMQRYCAMERKLRASGFELAYRFSFSWERWDRRPAAFFRALVPRPRSERTPWRGTRCSGEKCAKLARAWSVEF